MFDKDENMDGVPAIYLGRIVSKEHFRTFIYATDGSQKLVNSWDEFEKHMESGLWFATKEDAVTRIPVEKPKRVRKPVPVMALEPKEESIEESAQDVKDDNFLPKEK
jgi:hypothetical protein